jgi:DNA repair protein RecN (Recombination protein N)
MLLELRVENLLLIERAELSLGPGLNVITGETGAGKTMLTHALDLLLGGRPRKGLVRPGAAEAYVEGVFSLPAPLADGPELGELSERLALTGDEVVLARRVTAEGRTRAYVQGRSASAQDLAAIGSRLLTFYGQHEHRRLTLAAVQLDLLDAFCGEGQLATRTAFEGLWARARSLTRELEELRERSGARERDLDLLEFELGEIEEAAPMLEEEDELELERVRLSSVEALRQAAFTASSELEADGDDGRGKGAVSALSAARAALAGAQGADPALDELGARLEQLAYEAEDVVRELGACESSLEADPERLEQIGERLELFARLKRKHGGSIAAVLAHAERCREERDRLSNAGETAATLEAELDAGAERLHRLAGELTGARRKAARQLERAMRAELAQLAMADASFEVSLVERDGEATEPLGSLGPHGAETVELLIAPNPGVAAGRLREIASGGELSRVMLALMSIATASGEAPTVVFDEVDAGVGGNTARAVGDRLRRLGSRRQVLCITHLPQVASLAAHHFRVVKDSTGAVATAHVERLEQGELVAELCRMLGADEGDGAARMHAERLLQAA